MMSSKNFNSYDKTTLDNQLYIAMIQILTDFAYIMYSQPYWKGQCSQPIDEGVWRHGYKELVMIHRLVRIPTKQNKS